MKQSFLFLFLTSILVSCVPKNRLTYLQEKEDSSSKYQLQRNSYRVQPNDILTITIRTFDQETALLFNIQNINQQNGLQAGEIIFYLQGYSVDLAGQITLPIIGNLEVQGLTVMEVQDLVKKELLPYFNKEAINVSAKLAGIQYSVVGEVKNAGKYVIYQNQVNIFEALAKAGDITIVGDRKKVMIVRQKPDEVETIYLDLTDSQVINSPNYFIQPNDIINVNPLAQKSYGIGTTGFQTFSQLLSVIASTITLIIAINSLN